MNAWVGTVDETSTCGGVVVPECLGNLVCTVGSGNSMRIGEDVDFPLWAASLHAACRCSYS